MIGKRLLIVTCVFKKGLLCELNNCRTISLTCTCCKVVESVLKNQMLDYLMANKLNSRHSSMDSCVNIQLVCS